LRPHSRRWLSEPSDSVASVFFAANCWICERLLTRVDRVPICDGCLASFETITEKRCEVCGLPLQGSTVRDGCGLLCRSCHDKTYAFERARSFAAYEGTLVRAMVLLKFERIDPLGEWFADRLAELVKRERELLSGDVVVPVPLHRDREHERGYNQADLIAKPLARKLRLPRKAALLVRTRPRPGKQVLSFEERWESVRGAFATRPGSQVDKLRVLLVDDVMTTGATMNACSRALLEKGAKSVIGLTVARALIDPLPGSGVP